MSSLVESDLKDIGGWWSQLTNDFQRLNQDYQDYIRDWNSAKAEELMKTKSFLMYKEKLVDYLRHFIQELQLHAYDIELIVKSFDEIEREIIFEKITEYELSIPRLDMENITYEAIYENITGKYKSIEQFFINTPTKDSEVENILSMTNEIIRKITRYAANILEMSSQYSSRKEEYLKVAQLFNSIEDIENAHKLSSQVFGISSYKHIIGELTRETESISSSIYDEESIECVISPRIRSYREKMKKTAIIDHKFEKMKMREKVLKEREEEQKILMEYLKTGEVAFEELKNIPEKVRRTFMRWLVKGIQEKGGMVITEHGKKFCLINPDETRRCKVVCDDGIIELPAYILKFEEK